MRIISSQDLFESYMSDLDEATAMRKRLGAQREAEIRQQLTARSNAPGTGSKHIDKTIAAAKREQERYVHKGRGESLEDFNKRVRNRATTYRNLGINRRESVRDSDRNYLRYSSTYGKKIKLTPEQRHLSNVRGELRMAGTWTPGERQNLDPETKKRYQIKDEFELWVNSLVNEGYDLSEHTWEDMYEIYESYSDELLDEGIRSTLGRIFGRKQTPQPEPESRSEFLRRKHNIGPGQRFKDARDKIFNKTGVDNENPYYKGGLNLHHVGEGGGGGNKWRRRLVTNLGIYNKKANPRLKYDVYAPEGKRNINAEFELWVNSLINEGYELSDYTWDDAYEIYESYSDYLTLQAFLINEGYVDSIQESDYMIENMDEDLIEEILEEGYKKLPAHKMMRQASRRLTKHIAKHKELTPEFEKDDKKLSRDAGRMYREVERHSLVKGKGRIRGEGQALLNRIRGENRRNG